MHKKIYYLLTLAGFFLVLGSKLIWPVCCAEDAIPVWFRWMLLAVPLLFPLRGLLKGNIYTFAWSHFLALFYFILAIIVLWEGRASIYGSLLLLGSLTWFSSALLYVRANAAGSPPDNDQST